MSELDLNDEINLQIDKRKLQALIDEGVIDPAELAAASLVHIVCPNNPKHGLTDDGTLCAVCKVEPVACENCNENH